MAIFPTTAIPSGASDFTIPYSCRFEDGSAHHLKKTFGSAGVTNKWSASFWFKRANIMDAYYEGYGHAGNQVNIMSVNGAGGDYGEISITSNDYLQFFEVVSGSYPMRFYKDGYRLHDPSAWMHILIASDLSQGVAAERIRIYFNGVEWTDWNVSATDNSTWAYWNAAVEHNIGTNTNHTGNHFDGYLAEIHWIDGAQLTPASFGETGDYGEWKPKKVTGLTYGTNGYYLDFADSAALGNDVSGNNNDFTAVNLTAADQMLDSPTNNFCTWNPLTKPAYTNLLSEGNLKANSSVDNSGRLGTFAVSSGKWYWEISEGNQSDSAMNVHTGIVVEDIEQDHQTYHLAGSISYQANGQIRVDGSVTDTVTNYDQGTDIVGIALDLDSGTNTVKFYENNNLVATKDLTANFTGKAVMPSLNSYQLYSMANFGQDSSFAGAKTAQGNQDGNGIGDFYYTPPTGYLALCTSNLPAVAVVPSEHFNTVAYTGDGASSSHPATQSVSVGFQPDLVWMKSRSDARAHTLVDSIRGVTKGLRSDTTAAEATSTAGYDFTSFETNGFTVGEPENWNSTNEDGKSLVAWNWKMGGAGGTSHTQGTRDTTVSANQDAGQSIMYWTGAGSGPYTLGHGLTKAPDVWIYKNVHDTGFYYMFHTGLTDPFAKILYPNDTDGEVSSVNVTATSSTLITVPDGGATDSPNRLIAWAFHSVEGYSRFGSYEGNGQSHSGTFVYTGFRPAYVMVKNIDASSDWSIVDVVRNPTNVSQETKKLEVNSNAAETNVAANTIDMLSNGFQMRTANTDMNASNTYIYLAFAETPFKYSNAR